MIKWTELAEKYEELKPFIGYLKGDFPYLHIPPEEMGAYIKENPLTNEEFEELLQNKRSKKSIIDLNVMQEGVYNAMCIHKYNGKECSLPVNDGSGELYCPICGERWDPQAVEEEVKSHVEQLLEDIKKFG